jgi:hypothetical protein
MKAKTIAICLITNNNYLETRYVIENLMLKTACKYRLQIVDNGSTDTDLKDYLKHLTTKNKGYLKEFPSVKPLAECYDFLLQTVYQDICVFFPTNCLVNNRWLEDLVTNINAVANSGIVGIRPNGTQIRFTPVLHNSYTKEDDYLENIIICPEKINTVVAFKKSCIEESGNFDKGLGAEGYELSEFAFRIKINGYVNCFIKNQTCHLIPIENEVLFPKPTPDKFQKFKNAIQTMFKVRKFIKD